MKAPKNFILMTILCAFAQGATYAEDEPLDHKIEARIYQVMTSITGDGLTSQTQPGSVGSYQIVQQRLDDVELVMEGKTLTWDGEEEPEYPLIKSLARTQIITRAEETAAISVTDETKLQYFVKREDGLFELKEINNEPLGLALDVILKDYDGEKKSIELKSDLEYVWVKSREKIEGVDLNVGRISLEIMNLTSFAKTRLGEWLLHTVHIPSRGYIYLFLKVSAEEPEK